MAHLENQPPSCYNLSMSVFIPLAVLALSILIMTFLNLTPGIYALFCHYCYGKYNEKKTQDFTFFFILGAEIVASCLFLSTYLLVAIVIADFPRTIINYFAWVLIGLFIALAIASLFFYFRPGNGTRLFIPRKIANSYNYNAKNAKTRSDAFCLGALSGIPELLFTLPLYIVTSSEILKMSNSHPASSLLTILYIVIPIVPLFIMRFNYRHGHNLADIERSRVHDKNFTRVIMCISYLLIATIIICFRI